MVFMTTWFQHSPGWGPINKRRLLFLILLLDISSEMEEFDAQPYDFFFKSGVKEKYGLFYFFSLRSCSFIMCTDCLQRETILSAKVWPGPSSEDTVVRRQLRGAEPE